MKGEPFSSPLTLSPHSLNMIMSFHIEKGEIAQNASVSKVLSRQHKASLQKELIKRYGLSWTTQAVTSPLLLSEFPELIDYNLRRPPPHNVASSSVYRNDLEGLEELPVAQQQMKVVLWFLRYSRLGLIYLSLLKNHHAGYKQLQPEIHPFQNYITRESSWYPRNRTMLAKRILSLSNTTSTKKAN